MTRKDFEAFAAILGETLAAAYLDGGEDLRTKIYDSLYRPTVALFAAENERFNESAFSYAVERAETALFCPTVLERNYRD